MGGVMAAEWGAVGGVMAAEWGGGAVGGVMAAERGAVGGVMVVGAEVVVVYRLEDHHQKKSRQMNCQNCSHPSY